MCSRGLSSDYVDDKTVLKNNDIHVPEWVDTVETIIYVLHLEEDKFYVGETSDVKNRIRSHISGSASLWTEKYTPKFVEILYPCPENEYRRDVENEMTKLMMKSVDNPLIVRGGAWTNVNMERSNLPDDVQTGDNTKDTSNFTFVQ